MSGGQLRTVVTDRPSVGLVVGRDPSGTTWLDVRRAEGLDAGGWTQAMLTDLSYDPGRAVLELTPRAPAVLAGGSRLPIEVVRDANGREYRSRPSRHLVESRVPGGPWEALACFGGRGHAVGQLKRPAGVAVDRMGRLLVADAGNHRVQVVRLEDRSVVTALGCTDVWGAPCVGHSEGGMNEPVDVAVHHPTGRIAVADRAGGQVHVFNSGFGWCSSFSPDPALPRPDGLPARPVAVAWRDDGTLLIADTNHPRLLHVDADGGLAGELALADADHPRFAELSLQGAYATTGTAVLGPLDSGLHGVGWHDVRVELDLPPGTSVRIQTFASDDPAEPVGSWAPENPEPIEHTEDLEASRLVSADWTEWPAWFAGDRTSPPPRGTDRGRYLWVRIELNGARSRSDLDRATSTPSVHALRLRYPRPSWLRFLPAHWSRSEDADRPGALFVERFLALFERVLTDTEASLEGLPRLVSADTAPSGWLEWIASWLALAFDPSWPEEKRRCLLQEAMSLYKTRGTVAGLSRYLEIYTGSEPVIVEGFSTRMARRPVVLGEHDPLGCGRLDATEDAADAEAHRFIAYVHLDDPSERELTESVVRRILDTEKPAHTDYDLVMVLPDARLGPQSTVGLDFVLGHGQPAQPLCEDTGPSDRIVLAGPRAPLLDGAGLAVGETRLT